MTIHISGWFTGLLDLEICTLALCATITVCTIGAVYVVVSVVVGVIENSTKRLIHAAWHGPNNAGMNWPTGSKSIWWASSLRHNGEGRTERGI